MSGNELTAAIKSLAVEAGFARVGITSAGPVVGDEIFRHWLAEGFHAGMDYMSRNVATRLNPAQLVDGAKSVICLAVGYASPDDADGLIARYARGRDYHKVLKGRCRSLMDRVRELSPQFEGRAFVDTAPIAERSLAASAGLGWIGGNGCLIIPGLGSYVLLAEIVCNLELSHDSPLEPQCGDCGACRRACPTGAIGPDGLVDSARCISYLTIEHDGDIPPDIRPLMGCRVFGCDACQAACPHNRGMPPGDAEFLHRVVQPTLAEMLSWDENAWDAATRGSCVRRTKLPQILRNAAVAAGNSGDASLAGPLRRLGERRPELAEIVRWAVNRLSAGNNDI